MNESRDGQFPESADNVAEWAERWRNPPAAELEGSDVVDIESRDRGGLPPLYTGTYLDNLGAAVEH